MLWTVSEPTEIYSSARFEDLKKDTEENRWTKNETLKIVKMTQVGDRVGARAGRWGAGAQNNEPAQPHAPGRLAGR